jgi:hypothetical protein
MLPPMLSLFLLLQPATTQPIPPVFPDYFDTIQISSCLKESVFCPPGFANQSIASHSYYAYPLSVGLGIDANDISTEASPLFAADQTFIFQNGSTARTEIYGFAPGNGTLGCIFTEIQAVGLMPPDFLRQPGAVYQGRMDFNGVLCDTWAAPPTYGGLTWYVSADTTQRWVGFATPDGSQVGYFLFFRAVSSFNARVFKRPEGVTCKPLGAQRRTRVFIGSTLLV